MALRGARILSSCNEASNKQEQNMSVNIKVEDKTPQPQAQPTTIQQIIQQPTQSGAVSFPHSIQQTIEQPPVTSTVQPSIQQTITQPTTTTPPAQPIVQPVYVQPVNFTTLEQQQLPTSTTPPTTATTTVTPQTTVTMPTSNGSLTPPPEVLTYPSTVPNMANYTATGVLSRDFEAPSAVGSALLDRPYGSGSSQDIQIQDLETKNKFLTLMLTVYQNNPLYINSYVVCESKILMDMIKLLTGCEKVDLVLSDDVACGGCTGNSKLIYISKILITKDGKTEEFKYSYHEIYSKFISYGISLKVVV